MRSYRLFGIPIFLVLALLLSSMQVQANEPPEAEDTSVTQEDTEAVLDALPTEDVVPTKSDADSAAVSTVTGVTLDVPLDPDKPVMIVAQPVPPEALDPGTPAPNTSFGLTAPPAPPTVADNSAEVAEGITAVAGPTGSLTTTHQNEDGTAQMNVFITEPSATEDYAFKMTPSPGGRFEIAEDGGVNIIDANGYQVAYIAPPFATTSVESGEQSVPTYFVIVGGNLVQHVDHQGLPVDAYPVRADPLPAAIGAVAVWALGACSLNVLQSAIQKWGTAAVKRGSYDYKLIAMGEDCLFGVIFGVAGKFLSAAFKRAVFNQFKHLMTNTLLYRARRL